MALNDPFGLSQSGIPPELAAEYRGLTRQQAIEQAMLEQSLKPLGGARSAGRFMVAPHPLEGVAKIVQAFMARRGLDEGDRRMTDLGKRYQQGRTDEIDRYVQRKSGTPATADITLPPLTPNDDDGNAMPSVVKPGAPAVGADPRGAIAEAIMSNYAPMRSLAQMDLTQLNRQEERKDTQAFRAEESRLARESREQEAILSREARRQELELRLADGRLTENDRIAARQELARLTASLKEKQQKILDTPSGPMILGEDRVARPVMGADGKPLGPKKGAIPLSATAQKELFEADDVANSAQNAINILKSIVSKDSKTGKSQNDLAYEGGTANLRRIGMSFVPVESQSENATVDLTNKVTGQALEQLKAIFGGMPTEGERKILLELQGSVNQKASQRESIFNRAIELAARRRALAQGKAKALREGTYFGEGVATNQDGNPYEGPDRRAPVSDPLGIRK